MIMNYTVIITSMMLMASAIVAPAADKTAYPVDSMESTAAVLNNKDKKKKEVRKVLFNVHLHCANCVKKVTENISFEKGVKGLDVSLEKQTVAIEYDPAKTSEATLKAAIESLGYPVSDSAVPAGHDQDGHHNDGNHHEGHQH